MLKRSSRQFGDLNFQDLVAKVKNLVALTSVLGAISRPVLYYRIGINTILYVLNCLER